MLGYHVCCFGFKNSYDISLGAFLMKWYNFLWSDIISYGVIWFQGKFHCFNNTFAEYMFIVLSIFHWHFIIDAFEWNWPLMWFTPYNNSNSHIISVYHVPYTVEWEMKLAGYIFLSNIIPIAKWTQVWLCYWCLNAAYTQDDNGSLTSRFYVPNFQAAHIQTLHHKTLFGC